MLTRLPELIDPLLLADRNASIEGGLPISSFDRLADMLSNDDGNVAIKLFFGRTGKWATVEGEISAVLALKCQRCLESVEWPVSSNIKLGVVSSSILVDKLPDGYEPLLLIDEDKIPLKNIIEDELLLCLPDTPKHEVDCSAPKIPNEIPVPLSKSPKTSTENPFSILADLKNLKKLETTNGSTKK
jgi:uncharacterized protein